MPRPVHKHVTRQNTMSKNHHEKSQTQKGLNNNIEGRLQNNSIYSVVGNKSQAQKIQQGT